MKRPEHETKQARWLTDILSLGDRLRNLDHDLIAQDTVKIMSSSLGFEQITLYVVDRNDPAHAQIAAQTQTGPEFQDRPTVVDFGNLTSIQHLDRCHLIPAPGTKAELTELEDPVPWHSRDQVYVPLMDEDGLLGYAILDRPRDGLRPTRDMLQVMDIMAGQAAMALQNAQLQASVDRALDDRLAELATLQEIDRQINAKLDLHHVMDTTLDWAIHTTFAVAGTIALLEAAEAPSPANPHSGQTPKIPPSSHSDQSPAQGQHQLRVIAHRGYPAEMAKYWHIPWPIDKGLAGHVVRTGETTVIDDVTHDTGDVHQSVSPRSHLAAPIKRDDKVVGVISLESAVPNGFTADHIAFLMRLADHAAIAIENAQLYEQTNRRIAELESLQEISLDLTSSLHLEAVLDSIVTHSHTLTGADHIALYLYDEHEKMLYYGTGLPGQGTEDHPPVPIDQDRITAAVARGRKAMVIHNARGQSIAPGVKWRVSAIASIPVLKSDRVLGVFDISFQEPHTFTHDELCVLHLLADQAAIAIENAQLYADMQHAKDAKNEFISVVSHEFKVPMTSIQGYARLIALEEGSPITEQQRGYLDIIQKNVRRMNALIDSLVDWSGIECRHALPPANSVHLSTSVERALPIVRHRYRAHPHPIAVDIPDELPQVHANVDRIAQVWVNLLGAAHRYTPDSDPIKVWARIQNHRGAQPNKENWILCAVEHPGIAFAPEERKRVFEPFYCVERAEATRNPETGLELAIARSIVELYGGHIWVESKDGMGNTFYFCIPTRSLYESLHSSR